jgi:hypothetical protein
MTISISTLLGLPPLPPSPPPLVPVCGCGVHMYAPDSQAAGACFLCRKKGPDEGLRQDDR